MDDCVVNQPVLIDTETGIVRSADIIAELQPSQSSCPWPPNLRPEFFDTPRFSPDGEHFLIRAWCVASLIHATTCGLTLWIDRYHPYMSWESSELWLCDIEPIIDPSTGELVTLITSNLRPILGREEEVALGEPNWLNASTFMFTNDVDGYINPWIYDLLTDKARPLLTSVVKEDFGQASWWCKLSSKCACIRSDLSPRSWYVSQRGPR